VLACGLTNFGAGSLLLIRHVSPVSYTQIFFLIGHGEIVFVKLFGRLAKESPFFIDWTDKMDFLFGELLRSLKLNVSSDQVNLWTSTNVYSTIAPLIVYNMGGKNNIVQPYIEKLFRMLKNYFHPSNSGAHTQNLLSFILLVSNEMASRLQRERHNPKRYIIQVKLFLFYSLIFLGSRGISTYESELRRFC
jgi:hypothetical protein